MTVSVDALRYFLEFSHAAVPDNAELKKLLQILENDEEIVSHLVLKKDVFSECPDLEEILISVARENTIVPPGMKANREDLLRRQVLRQEMITKLNDVLEAEKSVVSHAEEFLHARKAASEMCAGSKNGATLAYSMVLPNRDL